MTTDVTTHTNIGHGDGFNEPIIRPVKDAEITWSLRGQEVDILVQQNVMLCGSPKNHYWTLQYPEREVDGTTPIDMTTAQRMQLAEMIGYLKGLWEEEKEILDILLMSKDCSLYKVNRNRLVYRTPIGYSGRGLFNTVFVEVEVSYHPTVTYYNDSIPAYCQAYASIGIKDNNNNDVYLVSFALTNVDGVFDMTPLTDYFAANDFLGVGIVMRSISSLTVKALNDQLDSTLTQYLLEVYC